MHELGVIFYVVRDVKKVAEENNVKKVSAVTLEIGEVTGIGPQAAFEAAAGHIRSLMAKKLSWRVAPELRFYVDTSVDQAEAISQALNSEREHQEKRIEEETIGEDREY